MPEDILKTAEKYLFPRRLTPADIEDAPRVIRALAGQLNARVEHGGDPVTEAQLVAALDHHTAEPHATSETVAAAILKKFKVTVK